jgi:formylglycine-generating enzyme required for sulfatase activity
MLHVATAPELFDRVLWFAATDARREELARQVGELLGPDFRLAGFATYAGTQRPIAVFSHMSVGEFSLIPGGGFDMGLSLEEERQIREAREGSGTSPVDFNQEFDLLLSEIGQMRPLHRVVVPPFLIAQRPLTVGQAQRWLEGFRDRLYGDVPTAAAHLTAEQITAVLLATGLRLPSEAELEYAARGGLDHCLLPTGDRIPDENTIEAMLADADGATNNAYGLYGYGLYPELCADSWREHYKGAPDDGAAWRGTPMLVVRGGAADCYPWQGAGEWNMLLCAFRMNDRAAEFGAAVRLVRELVERDESWVQDEEEPPAKKGKKAAKAGAKKSAGKAAAKAGAKKKTAKAGAVKKVPAKKAAGKKAAGKTTAKASAGKKAAGEKTAKASAGKKAAGKKTAKAGVAKKAAAKKTAKTSAGKKIAKAGAAKKAAGKAPAKKAGAKTSAAKKAAKR